MKAGVARRGPRLLFVTGTGTGVGKTVVMGALCRYFQLQGVSVRALKPVSTGGRADAIKLHRLQRGQCSLDVINPFSFKRPLAPWVAAQMEGKRLSVKRLVNRIVDASGNVQVVLVEGAGGVLVPVSRKDSVRDWISVLGSPCILVAPNKLGVINQVLLSIEALQKCQGNLRVCVVLVDQKKEDLASKSNLRVLKSLVGAVPVFSLNRINANDLWSTTCELSIQEIKKTLARLAGFARFSPLFNKFGTSRSFRKQKKKSG